MLYDEKSNFTIHEKTQNDREGTCRKMRSFCLHPKKSD